MIDALAAGRPRPSGGAVRGRRRGQRSPPPGPRCPREERAAPSPDRRPRRDGRVRRWPRRRCLAAMASSGASGSPSFSEVATYRSSMPYARAGLPRNPVKITRSPSPVVATSRRIRASSPPPPTRRSATPGTRLARRRRAWSRISSRLTGSQRLTQPSTKSPAVRPSVSRRIGTCWSAWSISSTSIPLKTTTLCSRRKSRSARPSASWERETLMTVWVTRESRRSRARYRLLTEPGVTPVVDAVEGVDGGNPRRARGQASVEPGPLAVAVHDVDPMLPHQAPGQREMARAQPAHRQLHHGNAELPEPIEEDTVARRRHDHLELVPGEVANEVVDVLGPAPGTGRDEQVEHPDGHRHVRARPAVNSRRRCARRAPGRRSAASGLSRNTAHHHG